MASKWVADGRDVQVEMTPFANDGWTRLGLPIAGRASDATG
jgi:hypothetical protein